MRIRIKAAPNARYAKLVLLPDGSYKASIDAEPFGGKANIRLIELLAAHFGIPKSSIRIEKGLMSKNKTVHIIGVSRQSK